MMGYVVKGELNKIFFEEVKMLILEVEILGYFWFCYQFYENKVLNLLLL